jgi:condensin complex subunit 3
VFTDARNAARVNGKIIMPSRITALEALASAIPKAFEQAQNSSANHQKNFIALHKIHLDAAAKTETIHEGDGIKLVGERAFEDCFIDMVNRVLVVKKGIGVADRAVKFVAGYIKFLNAKGVLMGHWMCLMSHPLFSCARRG